MAGEVERLHMSERTFLDELVDQAEGMFRREPFCDLRTALNFAACAEDWRRELLAALEGEFKGKLFTRKATP